MTTVLPIQDVTAAVLARLQAVITTGDGEEPELVRTAQGLPTSPYAILYRLDDLEDGGAISDAQQWTYRQYQIQVVGGNRISAEAGQEIVRAQLMGWRPSVSGISCGPVELEDPSGVDRDDDETPPLFYSTDRYRLWVS